MRYLPTSEVATILGVTHDTAWRRIRSGQLPATNIGTAEYPRFRVAEEDLNTYLAARPWEAKAAS